MKHSPERRSELLSAIVAVVGTGVGFAFLDAGAFRTLGAGTVTRMLSPSGLQSAALGAGVTALLLAPVLAWRWRRK
jgi:hypothetical protein